MKDVIERLLELVLVDKELHDSIVRFLDASAGREIARAAWYSRRKAGL